MNQEQIAGVLAGHWSASTRTDSKPFVDRCDGCGAVIFSWGDPTVSDGSDRLAAHQAAVLATILLTGQAEAAEELAEYEDINTKMADILRRTANALKGEPGPLTLHSWHDLPEVAARAKAEALREAADEFAQYSKNVTNNNHILNPLWDGLADGWKRASERLRTRAALLEAEADPAGRALVNGIIERKAQG